MQDKEIADRKEQMRKITESLGSYFEKEDMEVGMVMSVLFTMLINTMLGHAKVPPHEAIRLFANAVSDYVEQDEVDDEPTQESVQWLN
jgi:hypothetical protein